MHSRVLLSFDLDLLYRLGFRVLEAVTVIINDVCGMLRCQFIVSIGLRRLHQHFVAYQFHRAM